MVGDYGSGKSTACHQVPSPSFTPSINQSIDRSINQPINQSINQSTNQSTNQSLNQLINQPINQSITFLDPRHGYVSSHINTHLYLPSTLYPLTSTLCPQPSTSFYKEPSTLYPLHTPSHISTLYPLPSTLHQFLQGARQRLLNIVVVRAHQADEGRSVIA